MSQVKPWQRYDIVVAGGRGAGKTSLATQYTMDLFVDDMGPFMYEDSYRKKCVIDNEVADVEIVDTPGSQEEFSVRSKYYLPGGEGFFLIYSITSRESFEEIVTFYQYILRFKGKGSFPVILLANKCDLEHEREVGKYEGRDLARHLGCEFIEISARNRIGVDKAFGVLIREIRKTKKAHHTCGRPPPSRKWYAPRVFSSSGDHPSGNRDGCLIL